MRDPASITTLSGTPIVVPITRFLFAGYFLFFLLAATGVWWPQLRLNIYWWVYLLVMYAVCEKMYQLFRARNIDLSFAFPLLFAIYILNFVSIMVYSQEQFPLVNRAEHLVIFVLLGYIVWTFFQKYLPHAVWSKHPYYTALLVLSVTSLIGVANEIVELFLDSLFKTTAIGPGFDTSLDLLMNILGSGLFLAVRLVLWEGDILKKSE